LPSFEADDGMEIIKMGFKVQIHADEDPEVAVWLVGGEKRNTEGSEGTVKLAFEE
jgi:hypothetical protein